MKNYFVLLIISCMIEICGCSLGVKTDESGRIGGRAYVDLGLSSGLLWATCNIGTNQPSDNGGFSTWENANNNPIYGDDWRLPSIQDYNELIIECKWEWSFFSKGYVITGPNGNKMFLPAAGVSGSSVGELGYYWASEDAKALSFSSSYYKIDAFDKSLGRSIRPVHNAIVSDLILPEF